MPEHEEDTKPQTGYDKYLWSKEFREQIIALCLDEEWYPKSGILIIKPEFFELKEEQLLIDFIKKFWQRYDRSPSTDEMMAEFHFDENEHLAEYSDGKLVQDLIGLVEDAYEGDLDFIKDMATQFAKEHAMKIAVLQIAEHIKKGELSKIQGRIDEALKVGQSKEEWHTLADIFAYNYDNLDWVIEDTIAVGDVFPVFGEGGVGKTWYVLCLAFHTIANKTFLDMKCKCENLKVFWVDQENRQDRMYRRIRSVAMQMGLTPDDIGDRFELVSMPDPPIHADNKESMSTLTQKINSYDGPKLIVFDNLAAASGVDNISGSEMRSVMAGLNMLATNTGAAIIPIHHEPKANSGMYGSVYITNYTDNSMHVESLAGQINNDTGEEFGEHVILLSQDKIRDETFKPVVAKLIIDDYSNRIALNPRFTLLENVDAENIKSKITKLNMSKKKSKVESKKVVIDWVHDNPHKLLKLGTREVLALLRKETGITNQTTLDDAIKALMKEEIYIQEDTKPGRKKPFLMGPSFPSEEVE